MNAITTVSATTGRRIGHATSAHTHTNTHTLRCICTCMPLTAGAHCILQHLLCNIATDSNATFSLATFAAAVNYSERDVATKEVYCTVMYWSVLWCGVVWCKCAIALGWPHWCRHWRLFVLLCHAACCLLSVACCLLPVMAVAMAVVIVILNYYIDTRCCTRDFVSASYNAINYLHVSP